jgi:hypothetical protein
MPESPVLQLLCIIGFGTVLVFVGECLDFVQDNFPSLLYIVPGAAFGRGIFGAACLLAAPKANPDIAAAPVSGDAFLLAGRTARHSPVRISKASDPPGAVWPHSLAAAHTSLAAIADSDHCRSCRAAAGRARRFLRRADRGSYRADGCVYQRRPDHGRGSTGGLILCRTSNGRRSPPRRPSTAGNGRRAAVRRPCAARSRW